MYKPPLFWLLPPLYVCAWGVIKGDGMRFGGGAPGVSRWGEGSESCGPVALFRLNLVQQYSVEEMI